MTREDDLQRAGGQEFRRPAGQATRGDGEQPPENPEEHRDGKDAELNWGIGVVYSVSARAARIMSLTALADTRFWPVIRRPSRTACGVIGDSGAHIVGSLRAQFVLQEELHPALHAGQSFLDRREACDGAVLYERVPVDVTEVDG